MFYHLFDEGESTCFANNVRQVEIEPVIAQRTQFFCINPLRNYRKDANVVTHRNILVEFDKGSIEEQRAHIERIQLPYCTLTHSGNKSLHAIISLTDPIPKHHYRAYVQAVYTAVGNEVDRSCGNPSRFSRTPNAIRDNGNTQLLLDVRQRISHHELELWLSFHGYRLEDFINYAPQKPQQYKYLAPSPHTNLFLMFGAPPGKWHNSLLLAANDMARLGYPIEMIKEKVRAITGTLDDHDVKTIECAYEYQLTNAPRDGIVIK